MEIQTASLKQLKKLTVKNCGIDAKEIGRKMEKGTFVSILRIKGIANSAEAKETDYGTSMKIGGMFVARNIATGENFAANAAYFPEILESAVMAAFRAGGENPAIQIDVTIGLKQSDNSPVGFEYTVENHAELSDAVKAMIAAMAPTTVPELPVGEETATAGKGKGKSKTSK